MTVSKDISLDNYLVTDYPFNGEAATINLRRYSFNNDACSTFFLL